MVETVRASRNASAELSFAPHHVGNGFIRSACYGFVGNSRSGYRNNRIGISVKAKIKSALAHTMIIHYSLFIIHYSLFIIKSGRPMAAPTIIYLSTGKVGTNGTDKSVPYDHEFLCRPYSDMRNRQACSLRATGGSSGELIAFLFNPSAASCLLPLTGEPMWCGAEFNTALTCGGSFPVSSVTSTPGSRNMRIGSCVKAPLKKRGSHGFARTPEPGYQRYMYP